MGEQFPQLDVLEIYFNPFFVTRVLCACRRSLFLCTGRSLQLKVPEHVCFLAAECCATVLAADGRPVRGNFSAIHERCAETLHVLMPASGRECQWRWHRNSLASHSSEVLWNYVT